MLFFTAIVTLISSLALSGASGRLQAKYLEAQRDLTPGNIGKRAKCNADNCARAVTGTAFGTNSARVHWEDCTSFLRTTVSSPVTETVTQLPFPYTVTTTDTTVVIDYTVVSVATSTNNYENYGYKKRQQATVGPSTITPTSVPAYASACSGAARYSSACVCWGAPKATTTVPYYVATVTASLTYTDHETVFTTGSIVSTKTAYYIAFDSIPCNRNISAPGDGASVYVACEAGPATDPSTIFAGKVSDWDACLDKADADPRTTSFAYDLNSSFCYLYLDATSNRPSTSFYRRVFGRFNNR